jgi:hypothetical protein
MIQASLLVEVACFSYESEAESLARVGDIDVNYQF